MKSRESLEPDAAGGFGGRSNRWWRALAIAVLGLATLFCFRSLLTNDPRIHVPVDLGATALEAPSTHNWDYLARTDVRFMTWLASRNARTLMREPWRLFEAGQCHPAEHALAFGESGIALGIVGVPFRWATGDPVATFNGALVALTLLAACAMYLLIREWTACPPAAIAAAVLYATHAWKIGDVVHVVVWDTSWTVFALYFATRLFRYGRRSDAVGLACAIALQLAGSLYPLLASVLIAVAFVPWLVARFGWRRAGPARLAAVAAFAGLVAALVLGPYLGKTSSGEIGETPYLAFFNLAFMSPAGAGFFGWSALGLALLGLALPRRWSLPGLGGDPRWVLLAAGLVIFGLSVLDGADAQQRTAPLIRGAPHPGGFPNLYLLLSAWLPGLEVVRGPGALMGGVHLVLSALAGLGAAALLRVVPGRWLPVACALVIALVALDTLKPRFLGLEPSYRLEPLHIRPPDARIAFFEALAAEGDAGPLLELPVKHVNVMKSSEGVLLSAYHHRPTSYCYNSFLPETSREVEGLAARLPERGALDALVERGFRTLVVHHRPGEPGADSRRRRFAQYAQGEGSERLLELRADESLTAYRILR